MNDLGPKQYLLRDGQYLLRDGRTLYVDNILQELVSIMAALTTVKKAEGETVTGYWVGPNLIRFDVKVAPKDD